jgi:hypothetical protein
MNLEQIVKETVAKIVAEKKGKDLTGDGKIDSADYLQARSNAIEKAKGLDEVANKIYITHKGPSDDPSSNYMQYDLTFNGDEINAEEYAKGWKVIRYDDWDYDPNQVFTFEASKGNIMWFHQLQNLYFALTGIELVLSAGEKV